MCPWYGMVILWYGMPPLLWRFPKSWKPYNVKQFLTDISVTVTQIKIFKNGPKWPTWNTPKKGFLSRKRPKELGKVTFMKEWMNAMDKTRILALTHLKNLVSFPRYGRLKLKLLCDRISLCRFWALLKGHE